jgi:hypothetical protein
MDMVMTAWGMNGKVTSTTKRIRIPWIQAVSGVHGRVGMKVTGIMRIAKSGFLRAWAEMVDM